MDDKEKNKKGLKSAIKQVGDVTKREIDDTAKAVKIIKNIIKNQNATKEEVAFLKHQSIDIVKILGIIGVSVISSAIPILLDKILKPKGINIFPTEFKPEDQDKLDDTTQA